MELNFGFSLKCLERTLLSYFGRFVLHFLLEIRQKIVCRPAAHFFVLYLRQLANFRTLEQAFTVDGFEDILLFVPLLAPAAY